MHRVLRNRSVHGWGRDAGGQKLPLKIEVLAGLEPQKGSLFHAYCRKWATERKHVPDVDVAEAGGWKTTETLKTAYQQADPETMLIVVLEPEKLRESGDSGLNSHTLLHTPFGAMDWRRRNSAPLLGEVHFCARSSVG